MEKTIESILKEVCCDNEEAFHFCASFYTFIHVLDDLFDRDREVSPDELVYSLISYTEAFAANPFFQRYRDRLMSVFWSGVVAWRDSEGWRDSSDPDVRKAAEVLKSHYIDVIFTVAGLVGGLKHQLDMSNKYREIDWT